MGIEILILAFVLSSAAFGLVFPVVGWAMWVGQRQERLVRALRHHRCEILAIEPGDARTPIRIQVRRAGRDVSIEAIVRGTTHLWHLDIRRDPQTLSTGPFNLCDRGWPSSDEKWSDIDIDDDLVLPSFALRGKDPDEVRRLFRRAAFQAVLRPIAHGPWGVKELIVSDERLFLAVRREGLDAENALDWLARACDLVDVIDGRSPQKLAPRAHRSPGAVVTSFAGSPVGVPAAD